MFELWSSTIKSVQRNNQLHTAKARVQSHDKCIVACDFIVEITEITNHLKTDRYVISTMIPQNTR
jgi:hypothetical protein